MTRTASKRSHGAPARARVAAGGLACLGAALFAVSASSATAGAAPTVGSLVKAARTAILSRESVHIVATSRDTSTHKVTGSSVIDAGRSSSEQRFVTGSARVAVLVTPAAAYFSGNKDGLTSVFSMPADDVGRVGTKWVAIKKSESQYKGFATSVISALPSQILPSTSATKSVRLTTARASGKTLDVLTWTAKESGEKITITLELSASASHLPVVETYVTGTTEEKTAFGRWGEHLDVRAPKDTIPFSSLSAT